MEPITEWIKYLLPSLVVLLTTWLLVRHYFRNIGKTQDHEARMKALSRSLPIQLQAYERLALLLERITVDNLLVREQMPEMTARQFHQHLLAMVRAEFEHNLSQQIYVSSEAWSVVRNAREGVIKLVNSAAVQVDPDGSALELSKKIIEIQMEIEASPTMAALEFLRKEARYLMGIH